MKLKRYNKLLLVILAMTITTLVPVSGATVVEASDLPVISLPEDTGFINYSSDKTTIFLNTSGEYNDIAFFDFYSPLRPGSLKTADELSRYEMQDPWFNSGCGDMMLSLDELSKIYAPYFTYGIDGDGKISIRHFTYIGAGRPKTYTKTLWEASITGDVISVTQYAGTTTSASELDDLVLSEVGTTDSTLTCAPEVQDGKVYIPLKLMEYLGKIVTDDLGYIAIMTDFGGVLTVKSAASTWLGWETISASEMTWADYMDGVLDGSITRGHLWRSLYVGTVDLYTEDDYGDDPPSNPNAVVNRITSYRIYIPEGYDPAVPHKMTYMLHGRSSNQNTPFDNPTSHDIYIADIAEQFNFIILSPNGWTYGPLWGRGPARHHVIKSLADLKTVVNIDKDKVFITGNSQGGHGTLAVATHMPDMFQAFAATNLVFFHVDQPGYPPLEPSYLETIADMPGMISLSTDDTTIPFRDTSSWGVGIKDSGELKKTLFTTVEAGTHSQGWASKIPQIFTLFDSAICGPMGHMHDVKVIRLGRKNAIVKDGTVMVKLSYLEKMFNPRNTWRRGFSKHHRFSHWCRPWMCKRLFSVFEISAYASDPAEMVTAQNIVLGYENINIQLDKTIYRINQERYKEDAIHMGTGDEDSLDAAPQFSVAPFEHNGKIYVPALEVLEALGCTVKRINHPRSRTGVYRVTIN
jgi:hypothetical protein